MGTPHFMAPEQARGAVNELDARSDIFALEGVLYMVLTLEKPVAGKDVQEVLGNVLAGRITPPALRQRKCPDTGKDVPLALPHCPGGRVPEALSAVAMKALQVDPARRYQSVAHLQADLAAYQNGFATSARGGQAVRGRRQPAEHCRHPRPPAGHRADVSRAGARAAEGPAVGTGVGKGRLRHRADARRAEVPAAASGPSANAPPAGRGEGRLLHRAPARPDECRGPLENLALCDKLTLSTNGGGLEAKSLTNLLATLRRPG